MLLLLPDRMLDYPDHFDFKDGKYVLTDKATEEDAKALEQHEKDLERALKYKGIDIIK